MVTKQPASGRRSDALSKERIVQVAIEILDAGAETALTFRALVARLETGIGAIYWHVANKDELLAASTDYVVGLSVIGATSGEDPKEGIRAIARGVFEAIDAHPWVGTQLAREPWQPAMLHVLEGIGKRLMALGVPEDERFDAATTISSYVIGLAAQYAAAARLQLGGSDRTAVLSGIAAQWTQYDAAKYPFMHEMAAHLPGHDDREQFLAGIDYILAGIENTS